MRRIRKLLKVVDDLLYIGEEEEEGIYIYVCTYVDSNIHGYLLYKSICTVCTHLLQYEQDLLMYNV